MTTLDPAKQIMRQIELIEGTNRDHSLSQFFTPPKLAAKLVEWAAQPWGLGAVGDRRAARVLEPSAGNGAIVRELVKAGAEVMAIEVDRRYLDELYDLNPSWALDADFLSLAKSVPLGTVDFDLCVGNFPFHLDLTGAFTLHALKFAPRVCAIYPSNFFYSDRREEFWKQVRPTRIAYMSKRAWEGATDYCALELVKLANITDEPGVASVEWWHEDWR
jgi:predicted RNA methylase